MHYIKKIKYLFIKIFFFNYNGKDKLLREIESLTMLIHVINHIVLLIPKNS